MKMIVPKSRAQPQPQGVPASRRAGTGSAAMAAGCNRRHFSLNADRMRKSGGLTMLDKKFRNAASPEERRAEWLEDQRRLRQPPEATSYRQIQRVDIELKPTREI